MANLQRPELFTKTEYGKQMTAGKSFSDETYFGTIPETM
jgi:hypothetical protein